MGHSTSRVESDIREEKGPALLEVSGIVKTFPGVRALQGVDFDVRPGEIHALCGENGAGKSTLMRILAGSLQPNEGTIQFQGRTVRLNSPHEAKKLGILLIHQEISLVPQLDVAENIFLGGLPTRGGVWVDRKRLRRDVEEAINICGFPIRADEMVGRMPIARQQMVELTRALAFNFSVVIFDEPTASLNEQEVEMLFDNIQMLKRNGVGVVYISHKMKEIFELSDRVTVLRDGARCATVDTRDTSEAEITRYMIGRSLDHYFERAQATSGREFLRVENLAIEGFIEDVSFSVRAGEVLGFYGLIGSGRSEMMEAIFGVRRCLRGRILVNGEEVEISSPRDAMERGIALVPEDRKTQGLVLGMGARANMVLPLLRQLSLGGFARRRREQAVFSDFAARLRIKTPNGSTPVRLLSGGNQQKVVLAKWLATNPRLIILDEPTRGIDIGAKAEVHALIKELAERGVALVVISSEMSEVMGVSNRILTVYGGRITDEIESRDFSEERLVSGVTGTALLPARA